MFPLVSVPDQALECVISRHTFHLNEVEAWSLVIGPAGASLSWHGTCFITGVGTGGYMEWNPGGTRNDIEDRRGESSGGGGFGGFGGIHLGIGGTILLLILSFVFKTNLFTLFSGGSEPRQATRTADP